MARHVQQHRTPTWFHDHTKLIFSLISVLAMVATMLVVLPFAAPKATAAAEQNCTFRTGGLFDSSLCWLDMGSIDLDAARQEGGTDVTLSLPNNYRISFNMKLDDKDRIGSGHTFIAQAAPTWRLAVFGNTLNGVNYYVGNAATKPVLNYKQIGGPVNYSPSVTIRNARAFLDDPENPGQSIETQFSLVGADAESTNTKETFTIESEDQPIRKIARYTPAGFTTPCARNSDGSPAPLAWGTNKVVCAGDNRNKVGMIMGAADNPNHFKITLGSTTAQGLGLAVMMHSANGTVNVEDDGLEADDRSQFDMNVYRRVDGQKMATTVSTTDDASSASTAGAILLNRELDQTSIYESLPSQKNANKRYTPEWTCTRTFQDNVAREITPQLETFTRDGREGTRAIVPLHDEDEENFAVETDCTVTWKANWNFSASLKLAKTVTGNAAGYDELAGKGYDLRYVCTFGDDREAERFKEAYPTIANDYPFEGVRPLRNGQEAVIDKLPVGMNCTVKEENPYHPTNLLLSQQWKLRDTPAQPASDEPDKAQRLVLAAGVNDPNKDANRVGAVNRYDTKMGTVSVRKVITGEAAQYFTGEGESSAGPRDYTFTYTCLNDPAGLNVTHSVTVPKNSDGGPDAFGQVTGADEVPVAQDCSLVEVTGLSPDNEEKFDWDWSYHVEGQDDATQDAARFQVPIDTGHALVTVKNDFSFKRAPLSISRRVTGEAAGLMVDKAAEMTWTCTLPAPAGGKDTVVSGSVNLLPGESKEASSGIPIGSTCVVTETAPAVPENTIHTGNAIGDQSVSVEIRPHTQSTGNHATVEDNYDYQLTHVKFHKKVINNYEIDGIPDQFTLNYSCGTRVIAGRIVPLSGSVTVADGDTVVASATAAGDDKDKVSDDEGMLVPKGRTCAVSETLGSVPTGADLDTTYESAGETIDNSAFVVDADDKVIDVTNTFTRLTSGLHLDFSAIDLDGVAPEFVKGKLVCRDQPSNTTTETEFSFDPSKGNQSRVFTDREAPVGYICDATVETPGTERTTADGEKYQIDQEISFDGKHTGLELRPNEGRAIKLEGVWAYLLNGRFTVKKQVVFNDGAATTDAAKDTIRTDNFSITARCVTPNNEVLVAHPRPASGDGKTVAEFQYVPLGSVCTVSEETPKTVPGFKYVGDIPKETFSVKEGGEHVLTNTYQRVGTEVKVNLIRRVPGKDAKKGIAADHTYQLDLQCTGAQGESYSERKTATLGSDDAASVVFTNVPSGLTCEVTQNNVGPLSFSYKHDVLEAEDSNAVVQARTSWGLGAQTLGEPLSIDDSQGENTNKSGSFTSVQEGAYQIFVQNEYTYPLVPLKVNKVLSGTDTDLALLKDSDEPGAHDDRSFTFDYLCEGPDTELNSAGSDNGEGANEPVRIDLNNEQNKGSAERPDFVPEGTLCRITERAVRHPASLSVTTEPASQQKALIADTSGNVPTFTVTNEYKRKDVPVNLSNVRTGTGAFTKNIEGLNSADFTYQCWADAEHNQRILGPTEVSSERRGEGIRFSGGKILSAVDTDDGILPAEKLMLPAGGFCDITLLNPGDQDDPELKFGPRTSFLLGDRSGADGVTSINGSHRIDGQLVEVEPNQGPNDKPTYTASIRVPVPTVDVPSPELDLISVTRYIRAVRDVTVTKKVNNSGEQQQKFHLKLACGSLSVEGDVSDGQSVTLKDAPTDVDCRVEETLDGTRAIQWRTNTGDSNLAVTSTTYEPPEENAPQEGPTNVAYFTVGAGLTRTASADAYGLTVANELIAKPVLEQPGVGDTSVTVTAAPGQKFKPGDTITVTVGDKTYTHEVGENDEESIKIPVPPFQGGEVVEVSNTAHGQVVDGEPRVVDQPLFDATKSELKASHKQVNVGESVTVTFVPRDSVGNLLVGADLPATISVTVPGVGTTVTLTRTAEGTYVGTATPTVPAKGKISVNPVAEGPLQGSEKTPSVPFEVIEVPPTPDVVRGVLEVTDVQGNEVSEVTVGDEVVVTVTLKDEEGNPYLSDDTPDTLITSVPGVDGPVELSKQQDGTYRATVVTTVATDPQVATVARVTGPEPYERIEPAPLTVVEKVVKSDAPTVTGIENQGSNAVISGKANASDGSIVVVTYIDSDGTKQSVETTVKDGTYRIELPVNDIPAGSPLTAVLREEGKTESDPGSGVMRVVVATPEIQQPSAGATEVTVTPVKDHKFVHGDIIVVTVNGESHSHTVTKDDEQKQVVTIGIAELVPEVDVTVTNSRPGAATVQGNTVSVPAIVVTSSSASSTSSEPVTTSSSASSTSSEPVTTSSSAPSTSSEPVVTSSSAPSTSSTAVPRPSSDGSTHRSAWWLFVPVVLVPLLGYLIPHVPTPTRGVDTNTGQGLPTTTETERPVVEDTTGVESQPESNRGVLARTGVGSETSIVVLLGVLMMVVGGIFLMIRRSRKTRR